METFCEIFNIQGEGLSLLPPVPRGQTPFFPAAPANRKRKNDPQADLNGGRLDSIGGRAGLKEGYSRVSRPGIINNSDGCHVSYLEKDEFRQCDEVLWHELRKVVHNEKRAVHSLQNKSILTAVHYSEVLDFSGKKRNERDMVRVGWHRQALRQLAQAGIICTDPDNGLIVPSAQGTSRENKYILPEEIQDYYQQGSSVIYYQHKARKPDSFYILQHQALLRNSTFGGAFGQVLKFSTTSQRYYCFVIQPEHYTLIKSALYRMLNGPWSNHFVLL